MTMETRTPPSTPEAESAAPENRPGLDRRTFLGGVGLTVGVLATGAAAPEAEAADHELDVSTNPAVQAPESPVKRRNSAFKIRQDAAKEEKKLPAIQHPTNGDEELYANKIGNFTKTLPHNNLGEVDQAAYDQLLEALDKGDFGLMEMVPAGGTRTLANPLGGLAFSIEGPDSPAVGVNPPPAIASAEWAAQMAELYWMALLRDVPFSQYDSHPTALAARADLANFSGYTGPKDSGTGQISANQLFRVDYAGVTDGPMVSQFLYAPYRWNGIPLTQRISTAAPGIDFLTTFAEWLESIRGFPTTTPVADPRDPVLRFIRNVRDLGRTAGQDTINSAYVGASIIAGGFPRDANFPYDGAVRQGGFATFGLGHLSELVGKAAKSERHTWYQKWNVHRFLRPDAGGARVHNAKTGAAPYPIHPDLLVDSTVLDAVFEYNRQMNLSRLGLNQGSYMLPMMFAAGSPTHPSFPAGHAISAGACVTMLKAWFNESAPFPNPKKPSDDGLTLSDYVAGVDGPVLTVGGELNKLCHNLSWGRDMSGVHWRVDDVEGNAQGEEVAIRMLREERAIYPEPFDGFTLTKYDGTTITI